MTPGKKDHFNGDVVSVDLDCITMRRPDELNDIGGSVDNDGEHVEQVASLNACVQRGRRDHCRKGAVKGDGRLILAEEPKSR